MQTLVDHDLVDELRLMVFPVVLRSGKRLFGETGDKKRLRLVDSKVVGEGVGILITSSAQGPLHGRRRHRSSGWWGYPNPGGWSTEHQDAS